MGRHNQVFFGAYGYFIGAAAAIQPYFGQSILSYFPRLGARFPNAGGVDIAEFINLGRADNGIVNFTGSYQHAQCVDRIGETGGIGRNAIVFNTPGQSSHRSGPINAAFGESDQIGGMILLSEESRQHTEPYPKYGKLTILKFSAGRYSHHFVF